MKVKDIMTTDVAACQPEATLAEAAMTMWDRDCGIVPVVAADGRVTATITDRDICMAVVTKGRTADRIAVREVTDGRLFSCLPQDEVSAALEAMKAHRVRRLPVIDEQGHLRGMLSLNDVVLNADRRKNGISPEKVVAALQGISEHRHLQVA